MKKGSKNKGSKSIGSRIKDFYNKYKKPILIVVIGGPGVYLAYRGYKNFANKSPALPMEGSGNTPRSLTELDRDFDAHSHYMMSGASMTGKPHVYKKKRPPGSKSVPNTLEDFLVQDTMTISPEKKSVQEEVVLQDTGDLSSVSFDF